MVADHMPDDTVSRVDADSIVIQEVVVNGNSRRDMQMRSALNSVSVGQAFISDNFEGSLMQTLSRVSGVQAMTIGSGESKPMIRGLGFNRIVVADNGIRHEGQQWGDDHGLETDQFAVERAEIVKGPSALTYGSDAIGGVIDLRTDIMPTERFGGAVRMFARSNNQSVGMSANIMGRRGRFWYKAHATAIDYADYKVTVDSIQYYSYYIKLHDRQLRNTSGRELDGSIMVGYEAGSVSSYIGLSNVNRRSGFFANAHGIEVRLSGIDYDSSRRDIDLPFHTVNHLMLTNHTEWKWSRGVLYSDLAYQDNRQRERSEPVSHGYMPTPKDDLERSFDKSTFTARMSLRMLLDSHTVRAGIGSEYQHNSRGGWGFIIPDFQQLSWGAFIYDRYAVNEGLVISAGMRYDHGRTHIESYRDWYATPSEDGTEEYMERSTEMTRRFDSFTWSVGINQSLGRWALKANVGKSFRMPIAKELGVDGINYSIFRYEKGNASLSPEEAYQVDAGVVYETPAVYVQVSPFASYFPNYIYLNPNSGFVEGLQLYNYTQSKVFRWGVEGDVTLRLMRSLELRAGGEYLHSRQLSGAKKGFTLPLSPPWKVRMDLSYTLTSRLGKPVGYVSVGWKLVVRQSEVVPPEEPTDGYSSLNASFSKSIAVGSHDVKVTLTCDNILNSRYYDHTSYYRLIGVPEPGRNLSLMAAWHF